MAGNLSIVVTEGIVTDRRSFAVREQRKPSHGGSMSLGSSGQVSGCTCDCGTLCPGVLCSFRVGYPSRDRGISFSSFNRRGSHARLPPA
jgi:hypothetical protein